MTRLEKCEILKSKGYTYDPETGKIFGIYGKEIKRIKDGYIYIKGSKLFDGSVLGHHFAWYMTYGNVDFDRLDHINEEKKGIEGRSDNRICNLRIVTNQQNCFNTNAKGYYLHKPSNKWLSHIGINYKQIHLGLFNTEEEARIAYLEAKKKYHIID
jgi:hypothetical protein